MTSKNEQFYENYYLKIINDSDTYITIMKKYNIFIGIIRMINIPIHRPFKNTFQFPPRKS